MVQDGGLLEPLDDRTPTARSLYFGELGWNFAFDALVSDRLGPIFDPNTSGSKKPPAVTGITSTFARPCEASQRAGSMTDTCSTADSLQKTRLGFLRLGGP